MESIISYFLEKAPIFTLIILIITGVSVTAWKMAKLYFTRFKPMEQNTINNTDNIQELKEIVRNIERILLKNDNELMGNLSITRSPRQLSEKGLELYLLSGAKDLFKQYNAKFIEKLEKRKPSTALDVEYEAHSVALSMSDNVVFKPIKDYLYNHPRFDNTNIDLNTISFLISIELRDQYLEIHPELKINE